MTSLEECLQLMKNPFAHGSVESKVPDGKVGVSMGSRENTCTVVGFHHRHLYVMLTPNYTSPFMTVYEDDNHLLTQEYAHYNDRAMHCFGFVNPYVVKNLESPMKWRLVSAGLRLTLVDNSEGHDGWFEAIRVDSDYEKFMSWREQTGLPRGEARRFLCNFDQALQGAVPIGPARWESNPTYVSGLLSEIHNVLFYLQCRSTRNFVNIPSMFTRVGARYVMDPSFDTVIIRIHTGSDVDANVPNQPLNEVKVLINCVHNFEMVHDVRNTYAKFHSRCLCNYVAVEEQDKEIRRDIRAGTVYLK